MNSFNEWKKEYLKKDHSHKYLTKGELEKKYQEHLSTIEAGDVSLISSDTLDEEIEEDYSNGWLAYLRTVYGLQLLVTFVIAIFLVPGLFGEGEIYLFIFAVIYLGFFFPLSIGILGCKKWARILCYIHSVLLFVAFPIGTAISVLNIIALMKTENAFK